MRLKNKKTGEIVNAMEIDLYTDVVYLKISKDGRYDSRKYDSLAELNAEWEDAPEEPSKTIWQIKDSGELQDFEEDVFSDGYIESSKSIGNYFDTREEAEKAVEKLKAWKRLKDKGFRFEGWYGGSRIIHFRIDSLDKEGDCLPHFIDDDTANDLDLLFGGEE